MLSLQFLRPRSSAELAVDHHARGHCKRDVVQAGKADEEKRDQQDMSASPVSIKRKYDQPPSVLKVVVEELLLIICPTDYTSTSLER